MRRPEKLQRLQQLLDQLEANGQGSTPEAVAARLTIRTHDEVVAFLQAHGVTPQTALSQPNDTEAG